MSQFPFQEGQPISAAFLNAPGAMEVLQDFGRLSGVMGQLAPLMESLATPEVFKQRVSQEPAIREIVLKLKPSIPALLKDPGVKTALRNNPQMQSFFDLVQGYHA
jgi:hypothetical protein